MGFWNTCLWKCPFSIILGNKKSSLFKWINWGKIVQETLMFWLQFVIQISKDLVYWVNKLLCNFDATTGLCNNGVQIKQHQIYKSCIFPISSQNEKAMIFTLCTKLCSILCVYTLSETVSCLAIASKVCIELYSMLW